MLLEDARMTTYFTWRTAQHARFNRRGRVDVHNALSRGGSSSTRAHRHRPRAHSPKTPSKFAMTRRIAIASAGRASPSHGKPEHGPFLQKFLLEKLPRKRYPVRCLRSRWRFHPSTACRAARAPSRDRKFMRHSRGVLPCRPTVPSRSIDSPFQLIAFASGNRWIRSPKIAVRDAQ
jgi:hypothetical protein